MSVTYTAAWKCDECETVQVVASPSSKPPDGWEWTLPGNKHFCPKCVKEKGL